VIGIDTNILLRYVLADDVAQHRAAARLLDETCCEDAPAFVSEIVLVEAVWFLVKKQRRPKREVVDLLFALADNAHLCLPDESAHLAAVNAYAEGRGDFAEYLIAASNAGHGVPETYTFDKDASKDGALILLQGA
jgi:predicted nucleic-acid-binding protein